MPVTVRFDPVANSQQAAIIPNATLRNDGVMTKEMVAALGLVARDVTIYVSLTGDDANPGTTSAPVRTLAGAYARLPLSWSRSCTIQFLDLGSYDYGPAGVSLDGMLSGLQLGAQSSPLAVLGRKEVVLTGTVTANSNPGVVFTDGSLTMTPNALEGAFLLATSGPNEGQSFMIIENTATELYINFPTSDPIQIGDTFEVYRPGVTIQGPASDFMVMAAQGGGITGYRDIKFVPQGPPMTFAHHRVVVLMGCEIDLSAAPFCVVGFGVTMHAFGFDSPWAALGDDNPFIDLSGFTGAYVHDGPLLCAQGSLQSESAFVFRNARLELDNANVTDASIDAKDSTVAVENGSVFSHAQDPNTPGRIIGAHSGETTGLRINKGSVASLIDVLDISGSPGNAIEVLQSRANLGLVTTGAAVATPDPNTGAGIAVDEVAAVIIDDADGAGATAVTGTAGDTLFGHTTVPTTKTYANLHTPDVAGVEGFTDAYLNQIAPPPP